MRSKKLFFIILSPIFALALLPNFVFSASCTVETQKSYSSSGSSAVYYVTSDCTKRPFKNPDVFFSYFDSWDNVRTISQSSLASISDSSLGFMPWGPKKEFQSGTLVKTVDDPKVYVLLGQEKCWLKNETVFQELNYDLDWVVDVDSRLLDKYQICDNPISYTDHHPPGTLVKYKNSPDVYVLKKQNGQIKKDLIEDEQDFEQLGYRWDRIITIDNNETYPNLNDTSGTSTKSTQNFSLSEKAIIGKSDGTYTLREGQALVADNNIGIKLEQITQLDQKQKNKFGENKFWLKFNFYVNGNKITLKPIRFSGVYFAKNYNKLYGLEVGYEASKSDIKNGKAKITLSSLSNQNYKNCKDLASSCKQKGMNKKYCERKYCPVESFSGEKQFKDGKFITIVPDQISKIGDKILTQLKQCHKDISNQVKIESDLDRVVTRFVYGNGSAKTTNQGIIWPIKKDNVDEVIDKWSSFLDKECESNLMAHELTHHFVRNVSMDDIFHEGIANLLAQKVKSEKSSSISCKQRGWSGKTSESHASQIQTDCYRTCLTECYSRVQGIQIKEGESHQLDQKEIVIKDIVPKKFWPDTNKTGSYHGEIKVALKENEQTIDQKRIFIGDMYDNSGIKFLPNGIAIQKIVYPDRTEKEESVRIKLYSRSRNNTPNYCSSSCKPICQQRISENKIKYSNIDKYLQMPWRPTFKMFYNTSQCLFQKAEQDNINATKAIVKAGKNAQNNSQEFCVGSELKRNTSASSYNNLQQIFEIENECKWRVPRIANIDCWNKSCRPGKVIR